MASGFGGRYQGSVVDDADPIGEHRLLVIVPEVWGTEAGAWAVPSLPPGGASVLTILMSFASSGLALATAATRGRQQGLTTP